MEISGYNENAMPIFEYRCRECDTTFERILFGDTDVGGCPGCDSRDLERLLSSFAVSGEGSRHLERETGPCHCGAPRRGMCGEN